MKLSVKVQILTRVFQDSEFCSSLSFNPTRCSKPLMTLKIAKAQFFLWRKPFWIKKKQSVLLFLGLKLPRSAHRHHTCLWRTSSSSADINKVSSNVTSGLLQGGVYSLKTVWIKASGWWALVVMSRACVHSTRGTSI